MYYIWITGTDNDGWYDKTDSNDQVWLTENLWEAASFPTASAAEKRAERLYDDHNDVRSYEVVYR